MHAAYVYYRIDPAHTREAAQCIDALLGAMAPYCARPPRRMHRCGEASTWMEIYEDIADRDAFLAALAREVEIRCPDHHFLGERHLECFEPHGAGS